MCVAVKENILQLFTFIHFFVGTLYSSVFLCWPTRLVHGPSDSMLSACCQFLAVVESSYTAMLLVVSRNACQSRSYHNEVFLL